MQQSNIDYLVPEPVYFVNRKSTPDWCINKAVIKFHDLTYVYSGHSTYLVNDIPYHLKKGDFIYIPEGNVRQAFTYKDNPMQCFAFSFSLRSCSDEASRLPLCSLPFPTKFKIGVFSELIDMYKDFDSNWVEKNPGYLMKAKAILMLILHKLNNNLNNARMRHAGNFAQPCP